MFHFLHLSNEIVLDDVMLQIIISRFDGNKISLFYLLISDPTANASLPAFFSTNTTTENL